MSNAFVHVELNTTDVQKAKSFYDKLFDWTLQDVPIGDLAYTMIRVQKGTGGGMMKQLIPGAGSAWLPYVDVPDISASTNKARSLGEGDEGRHRSLGYRLVEHHCRPHWRHARPVAIQTESQ